MNKCSGRWREKWPKIERQLRQQDHQRRIWLHQKHRTASSSPNEQQVLQADYVALKLQQLAAAPIPALPKKNPWRNFKHGKALYQHPTSPKK